MFELDKLRRDFSQSWPSDLWLLEARQSQRRDAGPLNQAGRATGSAGAYEIPGM